MTIKVHETSPTVEHVIQHNLNPYSWVMITHIWLRINLLLPLKQQLYFVSTKAVTTLNPQEADKLSPQSSSGRPKTHLAPLLHIMYLYPLHCDGGTKDGHGSLLLQEEVESTSYLLTSELIL
jgi:hypothetical protein